MIPGPFLSPFQGSITLSSLTPGGAPLARGYCLAAATAAAGAVPRSPELPQSCAPEGPKESSRGQAKRRPRFTVAGERALKVTQLCLLSKSKLRNL